MYGTANGAMSVEKEWDMRKGTAWQLLVVPDSVLNVAAFHLADEVAEKTPGRLDEVVTPEALLAYVREVRGDAGRAILMSHFVTGMCADLKGLHNGIRLRMPGMIMDAMRRLGERIYARGNMPKYAEAQLRFLADHDFRCERSLRPTPAARRARKPRRIARLLSSAFT